MLRKIELIFLFSTLLSFQSFSQEPPHFKIRQPESLYDSDLLSRQFHIERRDSLRNQLPDNSVAVFFASPIRNRSNDVDYQYHQDPNFYYYTGYPQSDALVLIFKEPHTINGVTSNEFIFASDRDPSKETWTGKIPSKEDIDNISGIHSIFINTEFESLDFDFSTLSKILVKFPSDINENTKEKGSTGWLVAKFKDKTNQVSEKIDRVKLAKINASLREIKANEELTLLQKAISITCTGFIEALKAAEAGMTEYQLQAINEYFWNKSGSEYPGYPSIVGGAENSCVLHYETNRKKLLPSDMVVMDMGAEYHGYTADVTRSFPVSGKFSPEQKAIYQLVFDAQKAGIDVCKPGNSFNSTHEAASKVLLAGMKKLGIIKEDNELKNYFMHGTSHYLGLDVHDAGTYGPLRPNSIITVEPGIYIKEGSPCDKKWWNIGVRIEDDVLITNDGHMVMSDCVPKTIDEIEKLMAEKSPFNQIK